MTLAATTSTPEASTTEASNPEATTGRRTAPRLRRSHLLVFVLSAVAVLFATVQPASAVTWNGKGQPGAAAIPATGGYYAGFASGTLSVGHRVVTESPAFRNYNQWVCVTPRLKELMVYPDGSEAWSVVNQTSHCGWIPAAYSSIDLAGTNFVDLDPYFGYSTDVVVTWRLANNAFIGSRTYTYGAESDYTCLSASCYIDSSTVGAYVMFDF